MISLKWIIFIFIAQFIIFYIFNKLIKNKLNTYSAIQKIHSGEIPRIGGLIFFIPFIIYLISVILSKSLNLIPLLISAIIIFIFSFYEDLKQSLSPKLRLIMIFIAILLFCNLTELPNVNIPLLNTITQFLIFKKIIFILSIVLIINGFNFIDGLNGLSSFNFLTILTANYYLAYLYNDFIILNFILNIGVLSLTPLVFNFPFGKIFLGDSGSYSFAFIAGSITIVLFHRNPEIPTLLALLILAYPITEMIFSISRKFFIGISPMSPDTNHLHHLFYKNIFGMEKLTKNNLASILMLPIWVCPFLLCYISINYHILNNLILYTIYFLLYFIIYFLLNRRLINSSFKH